MKNYLFLFLSLVTLSFVACTKDEPTDNQGNPANLLMQNTYKAKKMP